MGHVLVVGSANMDLVAYARALPQPGETVLADRLLRTPGGKGANQAVACSRSGARSFFAGAVGVDEFGDALLASLQASDVNVRYARRLEDACTGVALITVDTSGHNLITVVPGANAHVDETLVADVGPLIGRDTVVLMQLEIPLGTVAAFAAAAHSVGALTVLNPSPARPLPPSLLANVDVLVPNETELTQVLPGRDHRAEAVSELLNAGVGSVVVTLGANGVLIATRDRQEHLPGYRVHVVDTTAAGDTLVGALASQLATGIGLREAVVYGNAAAAVSVQASGAQQSIPWRDDVLTLLSEATSVR